MSDENKDEFEHNDGLGDLLREREKLEFSWSKTIVVLCSLFAVVIVGIYFIFNVGKSVIKNEVQESITTNTPQTMQIPSPKNVTSKQSKPIKTTPVTTKKSTLKSKPTVSKKTKKSQSSTIKKKASTKTAKATISISSDAKTKKPSSYKMVKKPNVKVTPKTKSKAKSAKSTIGLYQYKVITGTFSNRKNALDHLENLKSIGIKGFIKQTKTSLGSYFRVQVGAYKSQSSAKQQQAKLQAINIDSYIYQE